MKKALRFTAAVFLLCVVFGASAWSQVSVPNTFSSGTAAKAAEVNENFEALVDAVSTNATSIGNISGALITGYSGMSPFPPSSGSLKNLVILRETNFDLTITYTLRIAYIAGDQTPTWDFPSVDTLADGTTTTSWGNLRWEFATTTNTRERTETLFLRETGTPPASLSVVTGINAMEEFCFKLRVDGVPRNCIDRVEQIQVGHPFLGRVDYRISTQTRMLGSSADRTVGQSVTINGITFSDIMYRLGVRVPFNDRLRIIANGIGVIYQKIDAATHIDTREIIYYRVNGASEGSLAGTPFDSAGDADGVFFTP